MHDLLIFFFALAAGLTLSGIVASLYRMLAAKPKTAVETVFYCAVMIIAGPSVLFENATKSFRAKDCSRVAYGFAVAIASYWAFALGLAVLSVKLFLPRFFP